METMERKKPHPRRAFIDEFKADIVFGPCKVHCRRSGRGAQGLRRLGQIWDVRLRSLSDAQLDSSVGELGRFARSRPAWRSPRFMLMWWERSGTPMSSDGDPW